MPGPALMQELRKADPGLSSMGSTRETVVCGWGWEERRVPHSALPPPASGAAEKADAALREPQSEEESYDPISQGTPRLMEEIGFFLFGEL